MLYEHREHLDQDAPPFGPSDITLVLSVRLHAGNPWVLSRLKGLVGYYTPAPKTVVVDFGSRAPFASELEEVCRLAEFDYVHCADSGVFSLAAARNRGVAQSSTRLVFLSDIDCLGESDLFARLAKFADATDMATVFDSIAVLPVYHLAAAQTENIEGAESAAARALLLGRALHRAVLDEPGVRIDYVDPQSNFFLIRRDFYDYVGGYNERFRGYGSEDFEFFLRVAHYNVQFPLPREPLEDRFSPRSQEHAARDNYVGFRRLVALMAIEAELSGLRIAHLDHHRARADDTWFTAGDRRRERLDAEASRFLRSRASLLEYDWMPRRARALVVAKHENHADFAFPLRLAGYALVRVDGDPASIANARRQIDDGMVDLVLVFNPYMASHAEFMPLVEYARAREVQVTVVERGALPDSWYYAPDLAYRDPDYGCVPVAGSDFSSAELREAEVVVRTLRSGGVTLEQNGDYAQTISDYVRLRDRYARVVLIPLQLPEDVAVSLFYEGFSRYADFVSALATVAEQHTDTLFLVKQHPLSKQPFASSLVNMRVCGSSDNIHALIDLADAVVCYNSGVGLLALLHERVVVTVGNAFYNRGSLGQRASSLAAAVEVAEISVPSTHSQIMYFAAWLIHRKYSFFRGRSSIREMRTRRSHEYRELLAYRISGPVALDVRRVRLERALGPRSYGAGKLGITQNLLEGVINEYHEVTAEAVRSKRKGTGAQLAKLRKLVREPRRFFTDARSTPLQWLGRAWPRHDVKKPPPSK